MDREYSVLAALSGNGFHRTADTGNCRRNSRKNEATASTGVHDDVLRRVVEYGSLRRVARSTGDFQGAASSRQVTGVWSNRACSHGSPSPEEPFSVCNLEEQQTSELRARFRATSRRAGVEDAKVNSDSRFRAVIRTGTGLRGAQYQVASSCKTGWCASGRAWLPHPVDRPVSNWRAGKQREFPCASCLPGWGLKSQVPLAGQFREALVRTRRHWRARPRGRCSFGVLECCRAKGGAPRNAWFPEGSI